MHLFLIRHGETEHNVAGLLAGVSDSRLTNHGVMQTQRLGTSLIKNRGLRFTDFFSSDLQRAYMTADAVRKAQSEVHGRSSDVKVVQLEILREQNFGSLELVSWSSKRAQSASDAKIPGPKDPHFKPKETKEAMRARADAFVDDFVLPLLVYDQELKVTAAVISHGLLLGQLWRALHSRFRASNITLSAGMTSEFSSHPLEHVSWSNTGYLELQIMNSDRGAASSGAENSVCTTQDEDTTLFTNATMTIKAINEKGHLSGLKRARGGIGSTAHDRRQQNIGCFFKTAKTTNKRTKLDPTGSPGKT